MTKSVTTKIDDVTYQKLIEKCESSNENRCQFLNRIIEENLHDNDTKNNTKSNNPMKLTKLKDGTCKSPDGVIITEIPKETSKPAKDTIVLYNEKPLQIQQYTDGLWRTPEGEIIRETDPRFEKSVRLQIR